MTTYCNHIEMHRVRDLILTSDTMNIFERMVLLMLAAHSNNGRCWPSLSTLAKECGTSISSVQRAIKSLVAANHLKIDRDCNDKLSNMYELVGHVPKAKAESSASRPNGDDKWKSKV